MLPLLAVIDPMFFLRILTLFLMLPSLPVWRPLHWNTYPTFFIWSQVSMSAVFNSFESVSLSILNDIIAHTKLWGSPTGALPAPPDIFLKRRTSLRSVLDPPSWILLMAALPLVLSLQLLNILLYNQSKSLTFHRPVSKLPLFSKILEKIAFIQLNAFLGRTISLRHSSLDLKTWHSSETALLRVFNDILSANDFGNSVILMILDLTSAFDTL